MEGEDTRWNINQLPVVVTYLEQKPSLVSGDPIVVIRDLVLRIHLLSYQYSGRPPAWNHGSRGLQTLPIPGVSSALGPPVHNPICRRSIGYELQQQFSAPSRGQITAKRCPEACHLVFQGWRRLDRPSAGSTVGASATVLVASRYPDKAVSCHGCEDNAS